jgi:alcohol dehydrogenase
MKGRIVSSTLGHRTSESGQPASQNGHFDFAPLTRVVYGAGTIDRLGALAVELGATRVLLVTDAHLVAVGHAARAAASLRAAGLAFAQFDHAEENPTTRNVGECADFGRSERIDLIVGLGGGSAMDCAKGCNFLLTNGGKIQDYWGVGKATRPMLPLIAVPTTAGTGSEAQSFALIADNTTHQKMACGDKKASARISILDPELTLTMPSSVTAATGIDAISHAVETYVSTRRNAVSQLYSREAWRLLNSNFETVLHQPDNIDARGAMLLGANFAGSAIENSMLGATHACANPVTAHLDIPHGVAIGILLPSVVRFNGPVAGPAYAELVGDVPPGTASSADAAERLAARIEEFIARSGQPQRLSQCGLDRDLIPRLAEEAAQQWTGKFNPRPIAVSDFIEVYQCAY